jgi:hypothetical protein
MASININNLGDYYYSGNIPDLRITASEKLNVTIKLERSSGIPDFEIEEEYYPTGSHVLLKLKDLIHNELYSDANTPAWQGGEGFLLQSGASGKVTITAEGETFSETSWDFITIKGALDVPHTHNFAAFFDEMPLSLCPKIRPVKLNEPVLINYFATEAYSVKLAIVSGDQPVATYISSGAVPTPRLHTINAMYSELKDAFSAPFTSPPQIHFSINENWDNAIILKLISDYDQYDDFFAFESSIGGIDTIRLNGVLSEIPEHEYLAAVKQNLTLEYKTIPKTVYEKNTGIIQSFEQNRWIMDFLASPIKYHYHNSQWKRIYMVETEAQYTKGRINAHTFRFAYADPNVGRFVVRQNLQW